MNSMSDAYLSFLGGTQVNDEFVMHGVNGQNGSDVAAPPVTTQEDHRQSVLALALESLKSVPVVFCAEDGMGKTSALLFMKNQMQGLGYTVKYEDLTSLAPDSADVRMGEILRWIKRVSNEGKRTFVALDNLSVGDESDIEGHIRVLRRMRQFGTCIALAIAPEGEPLVESMSEVRCYWSCDMRMELRGKNTDKRYFDYITHGIPKLVDAATRNPERIRERLLGDPGFQEAYCDVLASSLRTALIEDERMLRACMIMLGSGDVLELRELLGNVDADLWRTVARDAPFFGVNAIKGSFSCAAAWRADDVNACFPLLSDCVAEWPALVSRASRMLAGRGEYARAAAVSLLCSDADERRLVACEWAPEFINAGEVSVVLDAVSDASAPMSPLRDGAVSLLATFKGGHEGNASRLVTDGHASGMHREGQLASWCYDLMRGKGFDRTYATEEEDSALARALVLHGTAITLLAQGRLSEAHGLLFESDVRHGHKTLSSALVESDYVLSSLLVGIRPSRADKAAFKEAGAFFQQCGLNLLAQLHEVMVPVGGLLLGGEIPDETLEVRMRKASAGGQDVLRSLFLLVCAVADMRGGSLTLGHVRLQRAAASFDTMGLGVLRSIASLLDAAIRVQLGEDVSRKEIRALRGANAQLDAVVSMFEKAVCDGGTTGAAAVRRDRARDCPKDVLWLIHVLANDCRGLSKRFKAIIPMCWVEEMQRASNEICHDRARPRGRGPLPYRREDAASDPLMGALANPEDPIVEVSMLGSFEIRVGGVPLLGRRLESRRAKSMLALLAAVPGHVAKRFTLMESVWPEYDYESAKKCVYSATSKIRAEVRPGFDVAEWPQVIVSNKAAGTVMLNGAIVSCDVDAFEEKARKVLDSEGDSRRVVQLCREIEDLYKGDLFIPPNDGAGVVGRRSRELKELYGDAMVVGSAAAGALDMKLLACRFARKAHVSDELREDAVRALVLALCAVGRQIEALRCYEGYASRVITMARRPPSLGLRELVEQLVSGAGAEERNDGERRRSGCRRARVEILDAKAVEISGQLSFDFDEAKSA
ncbi:MAG: bacterial transcriptional activator domain-containing protein [Atopobiaceae bacterium]|nr:bacterial transcriptional activator domain-containing protein [Atopobiaceae bacterium]